MWGSIIQSFKGLNRTKEYRKEEFAPFAACLPSWDIGLLLPLDWDLQLSVFLVLRPLDSD